MRQDYIATLLRSSNTVFTFKDVALLWGETDTARAKRRAYRYVKSGKLYAIRRGIYAKDKNYDRFELATKIYTPSYVSFETVLVKAGVVFQFYAQIFAASYLTREITCDGKTYVYKKIKDAILTNRAGVETKNNYALASPERAFLDVVYLHKDYHFDNVSNLNWDNVFDILPIYGGNKRMEKKVREYHAALKAGIT